MRAKMVLKLAGLFRILPLLAYASSFLIYSETPRNSENAASRISSDLDINNLSIEDLKTLSNVTDWGEVLSLLGIDAPDRKVDEDVVDGSFSNAIIIDGEQAICKPELKTVELKTPPGDLYFPRCVRLLHCGGCCIGDLLSCQPTATQPVYIKVMKVANNMRGRPSPSYELIEEEEHLACTCDCRIQAHHCDPDTQVYRQTHCDCVCKDTPEQSWCLASNLHSWDINKCKCHCRRPRDCGTGEVFDHTTCRCKVDEGEKHDG
ncbi:unnamed protein product [Meganyctiphanes norvegica]|uniref:Platelet-derived growth factor (PDGF) family profile domain-containing protein n=1 Tax=Meganyctiphanes norvegica TaxID=48144 RepID=A0AAV2S5R2_MEGNR